MWNTDAGSINFNSRRIEAPQMDELSHKATLLSASFVFRL